MRSGTGLYGSHFLLIIFRSLFEAFKFRLLLIPLPRKLSHVAFPELVFAPRLLVSVVAMAVGLLKLFILYYLTYSKDNMGIYFLLPFSITAGGGITGGVGGFSLK